MLGWLGLVHNDIHRDGARCSWSVLFNRIWCSPEDKFTDETDPVDTFERRMRRNVQGWEDENRQLVGDFLNLSRAFLCVNCVHVDSRGPLSSASSILVETHLSLVWASPLVSVGIKTCHTLSLV